jgi:hypothetical protein
MLTGSFKISWDSNQGIKSLICNEMLHADSETGRTVVHPSKASCPHEHTQCDSFRRLHTQGAVLHAAETSARPAAKEPGAELNGTESFVLGTFSAVCQWTSIL